MKNQLYCIGTACGDCSRRCICGRSRVIVGAPALYPVSCTMCSAPALYGHCTRSGGICRRWIVRTVGGLLQVGTCSGGLVLPAVGRNPCGGLRPAPAPAPGRRSAPVPAPGSRPAPVGHNERARGRCLTPLAPTKIKKVEKRQLYCAVQTKLWLAKMQRKRIGQFGAEALNYPDRIMRL